MVTKKGYMARLVAKFRPNVPVSAILQVLQQLGFDLLLFASAPSASIMYVGIYILNAGTSCYSVCMYVAWMSFAGLGWTGHIEQSTHYFRTDEGPRVY